MTTLSSLTSVRKIYESRLEDSNKKPSDKLSKRRRGPAVRGLRRSASPDPTMSHDSWITPPLILIYHSWVTLLIPVDNLSLYISLEEGMNHDSWLMSLPTSNTDSQFLNHLAYPSFTPFHNLHCSKTPWIMIHDSWVIPPLILTHVSWIILFIPLLLHFTIYTAVRSHESWVMTPESSYL